MAVGATQLVGLALGLFAVALWIMYSWRLAVTGVLLFLPVGGVVVYQAWAIGIRAQNRSRGE
ncbi:MAG: hypothetical protein DLM59_12990 [Pseudonocardiales bacterium]|nr:MAG: hypothetical protein DLM59_12990 [Pseudonocardiales bacterium]